MKLLIIGIILIALVLVWFIYKKSLIKEGLSCDKGYYVNYSNPATCSLCPYGTFQPNDNNANGKTSCRPATECASGQIASMDRSYCINCDTVNPTINNPASNLVPNETQTECVCKDGYTEKNFSTAYDWFKDVALDLTGIPKIGKCDGICGNIDTNPDNKYDTCKSPDFNNNNANCCKTLTKSGKECLKWADVKKLWGQSSLDLNKLPPENCCAHDNLEGNGDWCYIEKDSTKPKSQDNLAWEKCPSNNGQYSKVCTGGKNVEFSAENNVCLDVNGTKSKYWLSSPDTFDVKCYLNASTSGCANNCNNSVGTPIVEGFDLLGNIENAFTTGIDDVIDPVSNIIDPLTHIASDIIPPPPPPPPPPQSLPLPNLPLPNPPQPSGVGGTECPHFPPTNNCGNDPAVISKNKTDCAATSNAGGGIWCSAKCACIPKSCYSKKYDKQCTPPPPPSPTQTTKVGNVEDILDTAEYQIVKERVEQSVLPSKQIDTDYDKCPIGSYSIDGYGFGLCDGEDVSCCSQCPPNKTTKSTGTKGTSDSVCIIPSKCDIPGFSIANGFIKKTPNGDCDIFCDPGYALESESTGSESCVRVAPNPNPCEGCYMLTDNNTFTMYNPNSETKCPMGCSSSQFCTTEKTSDGFKGTCNYKNMFEDGNCLGTFKKNLYPTCEPNGFEQKGTYTSDNPKGFGANCIGHIESVFEDHGLSGLTFTRSNNNTVVIGTGPCSIDCSGYWDESNLNCNYGLITKHFLSDKNTPFNGGMSCLDQAKIEFGINPSVRSFNINGKSVIAQASDISMSMNGDITLSHPCSIDCSGSWSGFNNPTCPDPSTGVGNKPLSITNTWKTLIQPKYAGAESCLQVAIDTSTNPYPNYASSIDASGENILQIINCPTDCAGNWVLPNSTECDTGNLTLAWETTNKAMNNGLDCSSVAMGYDGKPYSYEKSDGTVINTWIKNVKCIMVDGSLNCTAEVKCPLDCSYTITPWSDCGIDGKRSRHVSIHKYADNKGKDCPYPDNTTLWENCSVPLRPTPTKPDQYSTEAPCKLNNRPGTNDCPSECIPYLPPYCENINDGVDALGNPINGVCCPFYDPNNSDQLTGRKNCQACGTVKYHDPHKKIESNIIKMYDTNNKQSDVPDWKKQISKLSIKSQNSISDLLQSIF